MATKTRTRPAPGSEVLPPADFRLTPCVTTAERQERIQVLGQRIAGYVEFMGRLDGLVGTSTEAKDRAVTVFCERLQSLERILGDIQEELRLG